ncbi:hypothetical protein EDD17DRAFT_1768620 [Pisolithus thermaeus]|nr:hypothetical protein EV401DRAFT_2074213 [Pisolithus croceorrhizus]KAI6143875.1 hypothetical protein EDD17DRAFT_1768620 [Pisolithus thermaeus]
MFKHAACKPAASKIMNGLNGPSGTLELRSLNVSQIFLLFRCPAVWYSKHDLYNLIDKQKKVKIDSYEALLNYWLHFTKVAAHLQVVNQLLSIEKDDLYLKGFNQEF